MKIIQKIPRRCLLIIFLFIFINIGYGVLAQYVLANNEIPSDFITRSHDLFPVKVQGKWGYIDKIGLLVIDFQYNSARDFSNGLAQITIDKKIGYIDKSGSYVWEPTN
ncbi:WG repeat-containing protein [bacterium]|nr:WG repeat-containing protein [bacterium]